MASGHEQRGSWCHCVSEQMWYLLRPGLFCALQLLLKQLLLLLRLPALLAHALMTQSAWKAKLHISKVLPLA